MNPRTLNLPAEYAVKPAFDPSVVQRVASDLQHQLLVAVMDLGRQLLPTDGVLARTSARSDPVSPNSASPDPLDEASAPCCLPHMKTHMLVQLASHRVVGADLQTDPLRLLLACSLESLFHKGSPDP